MFVQGDKEFYCFDGQVSTELFQHGKEFLLNLNKADTTSGHFIGLHVRVIKMGNLDPARKSFGNLEISNCYFFSSPFQP